MVQLLCYFTVILARRRIAAVRFTVFSGIVGSVSAYYIRKAIPRNFISVDDPEA